MVLLLHLIEDGVTGSERQGEKCTASNIVKGECVLLTNVLTSESCGKSSSSNWVW